MPRAAMKVLAMPPPITRASTFLHKVLQQVDLGRNLGAADNGHDRARRVAEAFLERDQLCLHGSARIGRQPVREALGGCMGAMSGGKCVIDEDVAVLRQAPSATKSGSFFSSPA
jgi:hypothetical protein